MMIAEEEGDLLNSSLSDSYESDVVNDQSEYTQRSPKPPQNKDHAVTSCGKSIASSSSLSLFLNNRLIGHASKFHILTVKDFDLLQMTLSQYKSNIRWYSVREFRNFTLMILGLSLIFAMDIYIVDDFSITDFLSSIASFSSGADDSLSYLQLFLLFSFFLSTIVLSVHLLNLLVTFFNYIRTYYLVSTVLSSLENSNLCVKNTVQYLADYSSIESGFNFSHNKQLHKIQMSAIDKNPTLFSTLTELLTLDIISTQDSCSQIKDSSAFLQSHLCASVDIESVVSAIQNIETKDATTKIRTITSVHYELLAEFIFTLLLNLAIAFSEENDSKTSEICGILKSFVIHYDSSICAKLEHEMDLVHDLFTSDPSSGDFGENDTGRLEGDARRGASYELNNQKSLVNSLHIHLREIAQLTNSFREGAIIAENISLSKQRLQAAQACLEHLELLSKPVSQPPDEEPELTTEDPADNGEDVNDEATEVEESREPDDEVFLGESNPNTEKQTQGSNDDYLENLLANKAFIRTQRQLLSELNSVIHHKATERNVKEHDLIRQKYPDLRLEDFDEDIFRQIQDALNDVGRSGPPMRVEFQDGDSEFQENGELSESPEEDSNAEEETYPDSRAHLLKQMSSQIAAASAALRSNPGVSQLGPVQGETFGDSSSDDAE